MAGVEEGLSPDTTGAGTDLGGVGPFDGKPVPPESDVPDIEFQPEVVLPEIVGADAADLQDVGGDFQEVKAEEVAPQLCVSDEWCVEQYGAGVYCREEDGQCLPVLPSGCGWCGVECDHDDLCIALSPNLLCDAETSLCHEAKPLRCSLNQDCEYMGPDYQCNVKNKCMILPSAEQGCQSKEDCPVEPQVTICHDSVDPGVCAPPCDNDESCAPLGAGLSCNAGNGECQ